MARMRTIKPEFWTDDKVVELSLLGRLLFIGLWNFADDDGFIENSPKRIKRLIFPDQNIDVIEGLDELIAAGFLCVCDSDQGELLKICQFGEHQRPQHPVKTKFTGILQRNHDSTIVLMKSHEVSAGRVEESSVEKSNMFNAVETLNTYSDDFEAWWNAYPRKQGKGKAWEAWLKSINKLNPDLLIAAANDYYLSDLPKDPKFIPLPATWLNQERWNDELAKPVAVVDPNEWMIAKKIELS